MSSTQPRYPCRDILGQHSWNWVTLNWWFTPKSNCQYKHKLGCSRRQQQPLESVHGWLSRASVIALMYCSCSATVTVSAKNPWSSPAGTIYFIYHMLTVKSVDMLSGSNVRMTHCKSLIGHFQCVTYAQLRAKKSNIPMFSAASQSDVLSAESLSSQQDVCCGVGHRKALELVHLH